MPRLTIFRATRDGGWNDPYDYCQRCYPKSLRAAQAYFGLDPMDIDMDVEHPPYDGEHDCESCSRTLNDNDN